MDLTRREIIKIASAAQFFPFLLGKSDSSLNEGKVINRCDSLSDLLKKENTLHVPPTYNFPYCGFSGNQICTSGSKNGPMRHLMLLDRISKNGAIINFSDKPDFFIFAARLLGNSGNPFARKDASEAVFTCQSPKDRYKIGRFLYDFGFKRPVGIRLSCGRDYDLVLDVKSQKAHVFEDKHPYYSVSFS